MDDIVWKRGLDILNTSVDATTKTITAQLGDAVGEETESTNVEWWQQTGLASRPSKPTSGQPGAQAIVLTASNVDACIAARDVRCNAIYGNLDYGETCLFASGDDGNGQARVLLKKDGSINLYTRVGNTSSGAGMAVMVNPTTNGISMVNGLGFGVIIGTDGVTITTGASGGGLKIGADGTIKLVGTGQVQVDGATILLGSAAVPVVNAAIKGPTGISGSPSLKVLIE